MLLKALPFHLQFVWGHVKVSDVASPSKRIFILYSTDPTKKPVHRMLFEWSITSVGISASLVVIFRGWCSGFFLLTCFAREKYFKLKKFQNFFKKINSGFKTNPIFRGHTLISVLIMLPGLTLFSPSIFSWICVSFMGRWYHEGD